MTYLMDLVDGPGVPYFRLNPDDDDVQVTPQYLVQLLRDGRTNRNNMLAVDIVALVDDLTPVPYKSEFSAYGQPTSLTTRVARPPGFSVEQNRRLWRWDYFGLTDALPLVVTAGVPSLVTVKSVQDLYGSATGGAGGYSGWLWERSYEGEPWEYWSSNQNSQFVAYAGQYSLGWRLSANDRLYAYDSDEQTTAVCIPYDGGCLPMPVAGMHEAGAGRSSSGGTAPPSANSAGPQIHVQLVDGVFGSGLWVSREAAGESLAVQLYALGGDHDLWSASEAWPNSLRATAAARSRPVSLGSAPLQLEESQVRLAEARSAIRVRLRTGTRDAAYRLSFAVDPDLGRSASDDRLTWIDSAGVAVVIDPDSGAVAYAWAGLPEASRATIREYGGRAGTREPNSGREAFREQRMPSRVLGAVGDVRFAITLPPLTTGARGDLAAVFVEVRAPTSDAALAAIRAARAGLGSDLSSSLSAGNSTAPSLTVRQYVASDAAAFGLSRRLSDSPSFSLSGRNPSASELARIRSDGVTAVSLDVSAPQGAARIRVTVLDARGVVVRRALDDAIESGTYVYRWDGLSDGGSRMPPGVYQVVVEGFGRRQRTALVLTR